MKPREDESLGWWVNAHLVTGVIEMLTKSEIVLLAIVVLGMMATALATRVPSFMSLIDGGPSIARGVPTGAFRGLRTFSGEEKISFDLELVLHRST
jgi:hypothetical protein